LDRVDVHEVLSRPLAAQLLRGSPLARLAYVAYDGTPRVVPMGFVWRDGTVLVWTIPISAKVPALRRRPWVALTIDHDGYPARALLIRGSAEITVVPGVPDGYIEASLKTQSGRAAEDFGAAVRGMYDSIAQIVITPTWARLNDFETTLPKAVEDVIRRKTAAQ
jgi:hypothetical protein